MKEDGEAVANESMLDLKNQISLLGNTVSRLEIKVDKAENINSARQSSLAGYKT